MSEIKLNQNGLIFGILFDGKGGGRSVDWEEILHWKPTLGTLWIHLDRTNEEAQHWLENDSTLEPYICEALLAEDTRPRINVIGDGMLLNLRGINMNEGADPEDMLSIRLWCTSKLIISLRKFKIFAAQDIRNALLSGKGPFSTNDFISQLIEGLTERIEMVTEKISEELDSLEESIEQSQRKEYREILGTIRRRAVILRRYLVPQRDVLTRLQFDEIDWIHSKQRNSIREAADHLTRIIEDLDMIRERALVAKDMLETYMAENMNKAMYWLTLVAGIFLPLGLLTGLLGINVGGIPLAENTYGFGIVCTALGIVCVLQIILFRLLKLF